MSPDCGTSSGEPIPVKKPTGAELQRIRIIVDLFDRERIEGVGAVSGLEALAERTKMSVHTCYDRCRELSDYVEWRHQRYGCALVRLKPRNST